MSVRTRALAIGLLGPLIGLLGLIWVLLVAALDGTPGEADLRFFVFSSPHLVIFVGVMLSFVGVPLALTVAIAHEDEVAMPDFDSEMTMDETGEVSPANPYGWLP